MRDGAPAAVQCCVDTLRRPASKGKRSAEVARRRELIPKFNFADAKAITQLPRNSDRIVAS